MILHSTGGLAPKVSFAEGIANGIAPDGGLYMPDSFPRLPLAFFRNIAEMSLREIAYVVGDSLIRDVVGSSAVKSIVDEALDFDIPLIRLRDNLYVLELFHGPTLSFKDIGARVMAALVKELDKKAPMGRDIILATSGDSGGAVANAFSNSPGTTVFVLFPKDELTREQLAQFATMEHVVAIEVESSFDDCQALVKEALTKGISHNGRSLASGNSINAARELPSIIYYFQAYGRAAAMAEGRKEIVMSVPCGNLGSLCAALMAKKMGLPVRKFFAANNANDVFVEYLKTGGFRPQKALITLARAMDVGNPSNIARITDLYNGNLAGLRGDVDGYAYNDEEISDTIRQAKEEFNYLIDPQGATALRAAIRHAGEGEVAVALATAHPGKYASTMEQILGEKVEVPAHLEELTALPLKVTRIPPTLSALQRVINMR